MKMAIIRGNRNDHSVFAGVVKNELHACLANEYRNSCQM